MSTLKQVTYITGKTIERDIELEYAYALMFTDGTVAFITRQGYQGELGTTSSDYLPELQEFLDDERKRQETRDRERGVDASVFGYDPEYHGVGSWALIEQARDQIRARLREEGRHARSVTLFLEGESFFTSGFYRPVGPPDPGDSRLVLDLASYGFEGVPPEYDRRTYRIEIPRAVAHDPEFIERTVADIVAWVFEEEHETA